MFCWKILIFVWKIFLQYSTYFCTILFKKNTKIKLKIGTKSSDWNHLFISKERGNKDKNEWF